MKSSHLNVEQQQGKMYPWKKECLFCYAKYNSDISDAFNYDDYCSKQCELEDKYLP